MAITSTTRYLIFYLDRCSGETGERQIDKRADGWRDSQTETDGVIEMWREREGESRTREAQLWVQSW